MHDITTTFAVIHAAVRAGDISRALIIALLLQQRISAWMQLPAHHQRRRVVEDLGLVKLERIEVTFESLTHSPSGLCFVDRPLDPIPDTIVFARLSRRSPADFYEHTRLSHTEFLVLYQELRDAIQQPRSTDFSVFVDPVAVSRYSHRVLHPIDELLLWLYHADGNKHTVLSLLFDIDRTSVHIIADHVGRAIAHVWGSEVSWPSKEERAELYGFFSVHPKAVACMDGTHCRIDVPDDEYAEEKTFSPYKKYHTQNFLVCCDAFAFIRHVAGPFPGSYNDKQCFVASDFMDETKHMLEEGERLITDGGFEGYPMNVHPFRAPLLEAADEPERKRMESFNEEIALNRSLVEHVNHLVKARAQALAGKWTRSTDRQRDMFMCAAQFTNRVRRLRMEYRLYCMQLEIEATARDLSRGVWRQILLPHRHILHHVHLEAVVLSLHLELLLPVL